MKSKTFVMMFVAIGCGLVAAYLTARLTARGANQNTVSVLVAKEKIKAGDLLKEPEKLFVEMQYPAGTTPNAIASLETLKNKIVNKSVQPGQWLTQEDLSTNFGIELPKGYYGMAVKVDPASAAGGFILPRSKVNVVATLKDARGTGRARVVTVLQDVLVLAVDQTSVRPDDRLAMQGLSTATLAVKPSESQRLSLAQTLAGDNGLRLVLRAHDDDNKVPLQPLDRLEWDTGTGDIFASDEEKSDKTFKLAWAKEDIKPGTVIDDPESVFEIKESPFAPDLAVTLEALGDLKGKTVKHGIFKGTMVTTRSFDGEVAAAIATAKASAPAAPKINKHVLFIQNGGGAPQKHEYMNGINGGDGTSKAITPEATAAPTSDEKPTTEEGGKPAGETKPS